MAEVDNTLKIVVSIIGSLSAILAFFIFKPIKILKERKKVKNEVKSNQLKDIVVLASKESTKEIQKDIKDIKETLKAHEEGILCLSRTSLIKTMDDWLEKRYAPTHIKQIVEKQYKNYKEMHGNGVVSSMYTRFIQLPEHPLKKGGQK